MRQRRHVVRRADGRELDTASSYNSRAVKAHWMAEGARIAEGLGADVIDINMGCPAREVTGKLSGSALDARPGPRAVPHRSGRARRRRPRHAEDAARLGRAQPQRRRARAPRRGCGRSSSSPCMGERAASSSRAAPTGPRCARCRAPSRSPSSSTATSARRSEAREAMRASGAAGVMVGRGAYGAPWLPGRIAAFLATGRDPGPPPLATQGSHRARARRGDAPALRHEPRPAQRAQAHRLVPRRRADAPPTPSRAGAADCARTRTPSASCAALLHFYADAAEAAA